MISPGGWNDDWAGLVTERCVPMAAPDAALAARTPHSWLNQAEWEQGRPDDPAWLVGRWLGKTLVREVLGSEASLRDLTILSVDGRGRRNRPRVFLHGGALSVRLSLAHSRRFAYAAVSAEPRLRFGVDIADLEDIGTALPRAWFLPAERAVARTAADTLRIWTAKEACYKACQTGEAFVPQQCLVRLTGEGLYGRQVCRIRWQADEAMVRALAMAREDDDD